MAQLICVAESMPHLVFVHTKSDVWLLWTKLLGDRRTPLSSERPDYCQYPVVLGVRGANGGAGLWPSARSAVAHFEGGDEGGLRDFDLAETANALLPFIFSARLLA